jgi:hypothetical protein
MKNLKKALLVLTAVTVAACGEGGESLTLEPGTYRVSDATLTSPSDQCGLLGAYTDPTKVIGVEVNGTEVTFNLSNDSTAPANSLPRATLNANFLETPTQADYTVAFGDTCVTRIQRDVTGEVVDNNTALLTLSFTVSPESGTCVAEDTAFAALPCASAYQFTVTRQDG